MTPAVVWTTPALLRLGIFATWGASLLLMAATLGGALWDRANLQLVGRELSPALSATDQVHRSLVALDSAAQAEMRNAVVKPDVLDHARQNATDALMSAAENITERKLEAAPLHQLGLALSAYSTEVQSARDLRRAGDKHFAESYRAAGEIMRGQLLPVTETLGRNLQQSLAIAFEHQEKTASLLLLFVICSAGLLGTVLLSLQLFLTRRMRRLINPLLIGATAVTLVFAVYTVQAFERENMQIVGLKQLKISQRDWEREVGTGFSELAGFEWSAPIAALSIAALTSLGVFPRLREYSA